MRALMLRTTIYPGIDKDAYGGMTPIGHVIRDAWVFGLIPETETCANWSHDRLEKLYDKVTESWRPYGHLASRLPDDLRERHERIYAEAIRRARELGWSPELGDED
jgi:hypothetical protein